MCVLESKSINKRSFESAIRLFDHCCCVCVGVCEEACDDDLCIFVSCGLFATPMMTKAFMRIKNV